MATTIATLTEKTDGTLEGVFATIRVNAPIALIPNVSKASEEAPDYRIIHRKTGFEIGAGWNRISRHADPDAIIGYDRPLQTFFLQADEFDLAYALAATAGRDDDAGKVGQAG